MRGMSGKLWDMLVFRQSSRQSSETTIAAKTGTRVADYSDKQKGIWVVFKKAAAYAKAAIADAVTKAAYKAMATGGQSAYNLAFADYFTPPTIGDLDSSAYNGVAGSTIKVAVSDDFKVTSADVKIAKADGTLIEEGLAVASIDGLHWLYTATQANASVIGSKVTVTAKDLPANVTVKDFVL